MNPNKQALFSEVYYPETGGKPVAEIDIHTALLFELRAIPKEFFASTPDIYAAGNMLFYYVAGDPKKRVAQDIFVVRGVPNHLRRTYKVWEEGKAPDIVFEISSRGTWGDDLQRKWKLYARLGDFLPTCDEMRAAREQAPRSSGGSGTTTSRSPRSN